VQQKRARSYARLKLLSSEKTVIQKRLSRLISLIRAAREKEGKNVDDVWNKRLGNRTL